MKETTFDDVSVVGKFYPDLNQTAATAIVVARAAGCGQFAADSQRAYAETVTRGTEVLLENCKVTGNTSTPFMMAVKESTLAVVLYHDIPGVEACEVLVSEEDCWLSKASDCKTMNKDPPDAVAGTRTFISMNDGTLKDIQKVWIHSTACMYRSDHTKV